MIWLPTEEQIDSWPAFTLARPLRMLVSGCLAGRPVGVDGSTYGPHDLIQAMIKLPTVSAAVFCPEDFAFGTPRAIPDIRDGDGFDVLDGKARVIASTGEDWTDGMLTAAHKMLSLAQSASVRLAVLMDISAACGSHVIYRGPRRDKIYQRGPGVAAALMMRHGIPVVSQRDFRTLGHIAHKLGMAPKPEPGDRDHHESDWYCDYFRSQGH